MKQIQYFTRRVYGVSTMYLLNDDVKKAIKLMTGRKTMTQADKTALELLGFTFAEIVDPQNKE